MNEFPDDASVVRAMAFAALFSVLVLSFTYGIGIALYNVYLHPLAAFPGPLLARSSLLWRIVNSLGGRLHRSIEREHKKYGPVVRVSPNEISFASVASWKDIYGHQPANKSTLVKSEFYDMYGSGFDSLCIGSERDPRKHRQMKTSLSAAFSTKVLQEQEHVVAKVIESFIAKVEEHCGHGADAMNMTKWYEMVAFDILGDMALGKSFRSIESGKPHFWSELIVGHLYFITVADNLRRLWLGPVMGKLAAPFTRALRNKHTNYTRDAVTRRLESGSGRKDFLTNLAGKVQNGEIPREEMTAHVSTLVIAGGETVATFLAATTYYLLKGGPTAAYSKVCEEIRQRYKLESEIDATSAQQLPYLQAVINEGLRIYPPGSQGFPRLSPGQVIDGHWIPKGTEVYTSAWTVTHDERNFLDPMRFRPERWLEGNSSDIKEASQPFSLGPRGCLGRNFAMMEMNLILAKMFWRFDMELVDKDLDWEGESQMHVMWWKPDLKVRFRNRVD